jgi:hypothetical protein
MTTLYRALAPIYAEGHYIEIGQTFGTDASADIPISASYVPSPACDVLNADAIAALAAANPPTSWGVLGYWGIRAQFSNLPVPAPSAAWQALIHN